MNIFESLRKEASETGLNWLLIGGHAVIAYGFARTTSDLDLLVRKNDRVKWMHLTSKMGFQLFHDGGNFIQLSSQKADTWALDLMLVSDETFAGMLKESQAINYMGTQVQIPSLRHLIALKLHSLRSGLPHRRLKDFQDLTELIEANKLNVHEPTFRELVLKYGTQEIYEQLVRMCG